MHCFRRLTTAFAYNLLQKHEKISFDILLKTQLSKIIQKSECNFSCTAVYRRKTTAEPLRSRKPRAEGYTLQHFHDIKRVSTVGGNGGNGAISFLSLLMNEHAGPDGGDGGNGGHVIFKVSKNVKDLSHFKHIIKGDNGEKGYGEECSGKNAQHTIVDVPIGTIVRNLAGSIIADLDKEGTMFIAARGGAGGHGNAFFKSSTLQAPHISEYGGIGESMQYVLEIRSMAHIGLVGLPNAGKSTLLRSISRAKPKVAPYAFTTLKPHIGMVFYDDYEQIAVADLPGLVEDSHKNKGLGITFLKHAERCAVLLFIVDISANEPWEQYEILRYEINQFNPKLNDRSSLIIANKIDAPGAEENLKLLQEKVNVPVVPISAKYGTNISTLLKEMRILYDNKIETDKR